MGELRKIHLFRKYSYNNSLFIYGIKVQYIKSCRAGRLEK